MPRKRTGGTYDAMTENAIKSSLFTARDLEGKIRNPKLRRATKNLSDLLADYQNGNWL